MAKKFLTKTAWEMRRLLRARNTLAVTLLKRQGNQTLVSLKGLDENLHAVTLQLDPDRNDLSRNIGIQVDQFITRGEGSELYSKTQILQSLSKWKDDLSTLIQVV